MSLPSIFGTTQIQYQNVLSKHDTLGQGQDHSYQLITDHGFSDVVMKVDGLPNVSRVAAFFGPKKDTMRLAAFDQLFITPFERYEGYLKYLDEQTIETADNIVVKEETIEMKKEDDEEIGTISISSMISKNLHNAKMSSGNQQSKLIPIEVTPFNYESVDQKMFNAGSSSKDDYDGHAIQYPKGSGARDRTKKRKQSSTFTGTNNSKKGKN